MERIRGVYLNWRLVLAQTIVNAIALGLIVLIMPGIHMLGENVLLELVAAGLLFGVLNTLVRPILQFIMFRFLFISFGLVLIVINVLLLWLLGRLTPGWFIADGLWALLVAAVLVGVIGTLVEALFGLRPPIRDDNPAPLRDSMIQAEPTP